MSNGEQTNPAGDGVTRYADLTGQRFASPHSDTGDDGMEIVATAESDEHALLPRPAAPQGRRSLFRR